MNIRVLARLAMPLLALASAHLLSAQNLVVDKSSLTFSGQFGGSPVIQTVVVSSTGASIPFILVAPPGSPWLKVSGQGVTPAAVTVTADPTGLAAGTYSANIAVIGGSSSNNPIAVTLTISAIGVNPASLAFSYTVGSSLFPAPQSLTLSGAATACTASSTPTSGGNWFTLLSSSCVAPGSLTVLPNSAVINSLTAGTYSGTITITPSPAGQSPAVTVPLTLTVVPTPPVTVNPSALNFVWQTGIAAANPSQTFTINTSATQPLNFFISATYDTGSGSWISVVNPNSGSTNASTGSTTIAVTINPAGLAVGTYTGKLNVSTPGGSPTQQDIPVKLVVSNTQLLNVPNATLNFVYQLGSNLPAAQTVNITATSGTLAYAVGQSANSPWLSVPNAGSTAAPLAVAVNPAGLAPGTYNASVNVVSAIPGSAAQTIPVILKVTNDPTITASVSKLSFPYQLGQAAPTSQTVKISSSTGVPLNYTAALSTTSCGNTWLQLNGTNNSFSGSTENDGTVTVSVSLAGQVGGICDGTVTITATNPATGAAAVNSPLAIPVKFILSSTALLLMTPTAPPVFNVGVGATSVAPQNISLTSTSTTDVLKYTVAFQTTNGGNWLFVGPQNGSTTTNNVLTISVIPTGLAANTYTGLITLTATQNDGSAVNNSPIEIPVTLNVTAGTLKLDKTELSFEQTLGGSLPATQNVTIGSTGPTLNYTATANSNASVNWLTVSPASGNTSTSGVLAISVDGSKLTPGVTYNGVITINSPGASGSPATINVHFKVNPGTLTAPTTTLTFNQVAGGPAPAAQTIAVTGSPASLNFTVTATVQTGSSWLTVTPTSGATPGNVQVQIVNGGTLPVGSYSGKVTITSTGATNSPIDVPVVLNVVPSATLTTSPTSMTFSYIVGQANAPAQSLSVSATGATGTVPFTVQAQADGGVGQWLIVSPTTSSAPATLQVSVSPTTPAGTYTGRIVISSPNALAPATVPVTYTVLAIPVPVFTSVANAANYFKDAISPGENVVIFGTGVGPATLASGVVANNAFPTTVGNTRVLFDNKPAPIIYASSGQTSVMVPYDVAGRPTTSIVVEYFGVQSVPLTYNVVAAAPGIYTLNTQGSGPGA
ncbi:MAG: hypothetical protein ABI806_24425, partial [Candidatus Solibacter sp.]